MAYCPPEPLAEGHILDQFDCGERALNEWLTKHARSSHASGSARVFVTTDEDDPDVVVGYCALAAAQIEPSEATERLMKGQARHRPVPAVLLARLAVDREHQGTGVGSALLRDAMVRLARAGEVLGVRAMLVRAKHEGARAWYMQYGFEESPTDPLHLLLLLMKDLRAFLGADG